MAEACGQGMQVMLCMTNELLRDDLFLLNKKTTVLGQKLVFVLESHTIFVLPIKYCMSIAWPALAYQLHDQP